MKLAFVATIRTLRAAPSPAGRTSDPLVTFCSSIVNWEALVGMWPPSMLCEFAVRVARLWQPTPPFHHRRSSATPASSRYNGGRRHVPTRQRVPGPRRASCTPCELAQRLERVPSRRVTLPPAGPRPTDDRKPSALHRDRETPPGPWQSCRSARETGQLHPTAR